MTKKLSVSETLAVIVSVAIAGLAAWVAIQGPSSPIPVHFDIHGQADRYASRYELAAILAGLGVLNLVVAFLMGRQVQMATDPIRRKGLERGLMMTVLVMGGTSAFMTYSSLGPSAFNGASPMKLGTAFVCLVLIVVGAVVGRVGPNPFIGVRTPWAYKSRLAWDKSNRLVGRLFFYSGLLGLAGLMVLKPSALIPVLVIATVGSAAWAAYESWRVWRTAPEAQSF